MNAWREWGKEGGDKDRKALRKHGRDLFGGISRHIEQRVKEITGELQGKTS